VTTLLLHAGKVTEPLRSELIREVCIRFCTAWEHPRSRYPLMDDGGGGVCPEAAEASRWWEFVGLGVGVATNVGGSVYIVERHDVKDPQKFRTLGPPWSRKHSKELSWCSRIVMGLVVVFVVCRPGVASCPRQCHYTTTIPLRVVYISCGLHHAHQKVVP
jgi:hypothetical protein